PAAIAAAASVADTEPLNEFGAMTTTGSRTAMNPGMALAPVRGAPQAIAHRAPFRAVGRRLDPDLVGGERVDRTQVGIERLRVRRVVRGRVEPDALERRRLRDRMREHGDVGAGTTEPAERAEKLV